MAKKQLVIAMTPRELQGIMDDLYRIEQGIQGSSINLEEILESYDVPRSLYKNELKNLERLESKAINSYQKLYDILSDFEREIKSSLRKGWE